MLMESDTVVVVSAKTGPATITEAISPIVTCFAKTYFMV